MTNKRFFVAALALIALSSITVREANAQSCPNIETFGVHANQAVDKSLQSQIEITYFTTNDRNVLIPEKAELSRSASYISMDANQFVAKLQKLESDGLASIRKRQSATSFMGELAQLNLERNTGRGDVRMVNASLAAANYIFGLDRETEINVSKGSMRDGDYYRVSLLSWFISVTAQGAKKSLDYDANIFLKPGQTAVFKLISKDEVKRSG
ncbi:MAG TPA: hypothetical protein VF723_11085, partial [Pyrinomonadaceae bacterium]